MIQKDDFAQLTRYKALQEGESDINRNPLTLENWESVTKDDYD